MEYQHKRLNLTRTQQMEETTLITGSTNFHKFPVIGIENVQGFEKLISINASHGNVHSTVGQSII